MRDELGRGSCESKRAIIGTGVTRVFRGSPNPTHGLLSVALNAEYRRGFERGGDDFGIFWKRFRQGERGGFHELNFS